MFETLIFYKHQLIAGMLLGGFCSILGVFVLLKRLTIFGVTLSQGATCAVALSLLLNMGNDPAGDSHGGISSDIFVLLFTIIIMAPFFLIKLKNPPNITAILIIGFVFFAALSQILLAIGGQVQNHLLQAFFGNILTSGAEEWQHLILPILIILPLFIYFYRSFTAVAFDRDHAQLSGIATNRIDFMFYLIISYVLASTINLMGSFYTLAHLILPALFALYVCRSIFTALIVSFVYSSLSTVIGFMISLWKIPVGQDGLNLPTSSTVIFVLCLFMIFIPIMRRFFQRKPQET